MLAGLPYTVFEDHRSFLYLVKHGYVGQREHATLFSYEPTTDQLAAFKLVAARYVEAGLGGLSPAIQRFTRKDELWLIKKYPHMYPGVRWTTLEKELTDFVEDL